MSDAARKPAEEQGKTKPIDLSKPMQAHILAAVLRHPGLMPQLRSILNPEHFADDAIADILAWSLHHWDEHKEVPSKAAIRDAFREDSDKQVIKRLYAEEIPDPKGLVDRVRGFANNRAMRLAILKSAEVLSAEARGEAYRDQKTGKVVDVDPVKLVREASLVGKADDNIGVELDVGMEERIRLFLNPPEHTVFTTGMAHLDSSGVALARGEMGLVLGASKRGKSHVFINILYGALKQGLKVVYYSLEMSEDKVEARLWRRVAGKKADAKQDPVGFVGTMKERWARLVRGQCIIKRYIAHMATPDDIRAHLTVLQAKGKLPDMVIIDYGGLLKPVKPTGEKRHDLDNVFLEMRAIAGEFNVALWTAAQTNRGALTKDLVTEADVGEAYSIIQHIDCGIFISMTEEERADNKGRFFVFSRNEASGGVVEFEHDYSRSIINTTGMQASTGAKRARDTKGKPSDADTRGGLALDQAVRKRKKNAEEAPSS